VLQNSATEILPLHTEGLPVLGLAVVGYGPAGREFYRSAEAVKTAQAWGFAIL
jgi:hypothetical protein